MAAKGLVIAIGTAHLKISVGWRKCSSSGRAAPQKLLKKKKQKKTVTNKSSTHIKSAWLL